MNINNWFRQLEPMKHYFIAAALVFCLGIILGYSDSSGYSALINEQINRMKGIADTINESNHPQWDLFILILTNNLLACGMAIVFGLLLGILPLFLLVINGMMIGYIAENRGEDVTMLYFLKGILPHGIFEIPAFIIACALGLRIGFIMLESFGSLFSLKRRESVQGKLRAFIKLLLPLTILIAVLMLLAAIIESTITYNLMT